MTAKRWLNFILFTAAVAAAPALPVLAQPATPDPSEIARKDAEGLQAVLFGPDSVSPKDRDEAAKRLLQAGAITPLLDALQGVKPAPQLAVARAVGEAETPPPQLMNDLIRLLPTKQESDPPMVEAISQALVNYKDRPEATARLRDFVQQKNVQARLRAAALSAMGALSDKETAALLIDQLRHSGDERSIILAAADALAEMTGHSEFGTDVSQWVAWWRLQESKSPADFRAERLNDRFGELQRDARRMREVRVAIDRQVVDTARFITDPAKLDDYTLSCLKNPVPEFRSAGAGLIIERINQGHKINDEIMDRLRSMIADSSVDTRKRVAETIERINDPASAKAVLAQLKRERDPQARVWLIRAVAPTKDVTAVPVLITMLDDPTYLVAEAAAKALTDMGTEITKDPDLTRQVSNALLKTFARANDAGAMTLRERLVGAMVPLKDAQLVPTLLAVMRDPDPVRNTPNARISAIKALSIMNAVNFRDSIARETATLLATERDAGIRLEAAKAMGIIGTPSQAKQLYSAMKSDADPFVSEAAWSSLAILFDQFSPTDLMEWAQGSWFEDSPQKRLVAFEALYKKYEALGDRAPAEAKVVVEENLGALYASDSIKKPDKAIPFLLAVTAYWEGKPGGKIDSFQKQTLKAYLQATKFKEGVQFAADRIAKDPATRGPNQETFGRTIKTHVDELIKARDFETARQLLTEAKKLDLGNGSYRDDLTNREKEITTPKVPWLHELFPPIPRPTYV